MITRHYRHELSALCRKHFVENFGRDGALDQAYPDEVVLKQERPSIRIVKIKSACDQQEKKYHGQEF